jgi:hypothetical protein
MRIMKIKILTGMLKAPEYLVGNNGDRYTLSKDVVKGNPWAERATG